MATFGGRLLDRAFGHPQGRLGRLGGAMMARGNAATERRMAELAGITNGDIVLAIGCGPGVGVEYAARVAGMVIAVDPSKTMLTACRRRCANFYEHATVRLSQGTAQETKQPDAAVKQGDFDDIQRWTWEPPGRAQQRQPNYMHTGNLTAVTVS